MKKNEDTRREGVDALTSYMRDIRVFELLTPEQEIQLGKRIRLGDRAAYEELVVANLRLVVAVAKRYFNRGLEPMDVIQEGNFGLMEAASKFDYTKGFRFSTYATWWIKQKIKRGIQNKSRTIRLPIHVQNEIWRVHDYMAHYIHDGSGPPLTLDVIAQDLGISVDVVYRALNGISEAIPLDSGDGEALQLIDTLVDLESRDPLVELIRMSEEESCGEEVQELLDRLSPRERFVVECRFGLGRRNSPMTLTEVGNLMSLSRERIRQIENESLKKMRKGEDEDAA